MSKHEPITFNIIPAIGGIICGTLVTIVLAELNLPHNLKLNQCYIRDGILYKVKELGEFGYKIQSKYATNIEPFSESRYYEQIDCNFTELE